MSAYQYAFTLTPGRTSGLRSICMVGAAIVAVCVLSSTVVMRELVGSTPAQATTAATVRTWPLEARWWPGPIRQVNRQAPTVPDSELTFTKGYQLRLAARQAAQQAAAATRVAAGGPAVESQSGRSATVVRKANTVARNDAAPSPRRVSTAPIDVPVDPFARFNVGNRALAYDEERSDKRGFVAYRGNPSGNLFGNLY